jgi:two-component system sensor histidine kinase UhpB
MIQYAQSAPLNILVVEDNSGDFLLLKESIHQSNAPVGSLVRATTLKEAIQQLQRSSPDIVFLDLYLPDSQGLISFNELKEHTTNSAVIILSGLSDTRVALEAIALGAQDYLNKGEFDEKLLGKTMAYAIERLRNLETLRQANERYSLVTKATHDLVWDWDLVTGEVYRDEKTVKQVYGVSSNEVIHNIDEWNKRIHPDDKEKLSFMIQDIKQLTSRDYFEVEYKFLGDNGTYKIIYDRGYVVRNAEKKPVRLIGAAQDITEKRRLEAALEESRLQQQRALTEATIRGQENEREQLGKELHDNINQVLATCMLYLDHALSSPDINKDMVVKSREFIGFAIQEIRKLSHALLPPSLQDFGLTFALAKLATNLSGPAGFRICTEWDSFREHVLQKEEKMTIYRIVQEQMNNVIKHAEAANVTISLCAGKDGKQVQLTIKDDGKGFDPTAQRNGVGLRNIISRAELFNATVNIQSAPGQGCELKVIFPIFQSYDYIISSGVIQRQEIRKAG